MDVYRKRRRLTITGSFLLSGHRNTMTGIHMMMDLKTGPIFR